MEPNAFALITIMALIYLFIDFLPWFFVYSEYRLGRKREMVMWIIGAIFLNIIYTYLFYCIFLKYAHYFGF